MRLLISGYYGFGNAGDEAILAALVGGLRRRLPACELSVLSADPAVTRAEHGVHAADRWSRSTIWREVRAADLLIQGGGGLIQDATSSRSALYYLGILATARLLRTPYVIVSQGVGPLRGRAVRRLAGRLFRGAAAISVRDGQSAALLAELGVPAAKVEVTADVAALLEPAPYEDVASHLPDRAAGPRVGVALRPFPGASALVEGALLAAARLEEHHGAQVIGLALFDADDAPLAERVAAEAGGVAVTPEPSLSPARLMAIVRGLDFLIAMRLHAAVFAAAQGVPFIGLSYDPKVAAFADQVGAPWVGPEAGVDAIVGAVVAAWEARADDANRRQTAAQDLLSAAERNVDIIEEAAGARAR